MTIDNITSEHLNGSVLHLNRHGKLAMNLIKNSENCAGKTLIEVDNKVDSLLHSLSTMLETVYVIMIVKESQIQQVLSMI